MAKPVQHIQNVLQDFLLKSNEQVGSKSLPDSSGENRKAHLQEVWTVLQLASKTDIIATLQFASQNIPFSCAEVLAPCYQQQFPDSTIAKHVAVSPRRCHILYVVD